VTWLAHHDQKDGIFCEFMDLHLQIQNQLRSLLVAESANAFDSLGV